MLGEVGKGVLCVAGRTLIGEVGELDVVAERDRRRRGVQIRAAVAALNAGDDRLCWNEPHRHVTLRADVGARHENARYLVVDLGQVLGDHLGLTTIRVLDPECLRPFAG